MVRSSRWHAYVPGEAATRDALLVQHLPLVHHVARKIHRRIDDRVVYDELVSAGTIGLASALDSFDAGRRTAFSTYAIPRIRGAILDELRRMDHSSRRVRRLHRTLERAHRELTHTLAREPDASEQAAHLGVDTQTLLRWRSENRTVHVSLDEQMADGATAGSLAGAAAVNPAEELEHRLSLEQEVAYLRDAMLRLSEQARVVLSLYYYEGLKLREIAEVLGVSESRVSQIRARALATLRAALRPLRSL